ncbi:hypothetical protein, partial [Xanthomonas citri]|uniref:hypothetical protein n=2 Tax=Xanthomonas citri TaxID=346 RepID=UPI001CA5E0C9
ATGDGADALYALPRERFAHGKQLSWLRDRANQDLKCNGLTKYVPHYVSALITKYLYPNPLIDTGLAIRIQYLEAEAYLVQF